MFYTRVLLENDVQILDYLKDKQYKKISNFSFYDLIYVNRDGSSITEDTLKIRVYNHNEWANKDVLVIIKRAIFNEGKKEDKVFLREEFDTLQEALSFVKDNYEDQYVFSFKFEKSGVQYQSEVATIWLEDIVDLGISAEIGAEDDRTLDQIVNSLDVKERLRVSVPEYIYQKMKG